MDKREQMLKARELIRQKKYHEARKLLVGIDHPTAKKWIDKIDEILLGDPLPEKRSKEKTEYGCVVRSVVLLIFVLASLLLLASWICEGFIFATGSYFFGEPPSAGESLLLLVAGLLLGGASIYTLITTHAFKRNNLPLHTKVIAAIPIFVAVAGLVAICYVCYLLMIELLNWMLYSGGY